MPKKFFILTILVIFSAIFIFSYYFYSSHSLKSRTSNTDFNPKNFSEKILDQTLILAPNSLMYRFMINLCRSYDKDSGKDVDIGLVFNGTKYESIEFKYSSQIITPNSKVLNSYFSSESLKEDEDSVKYFQEYSFNPDDQNTQITINKKDKSFIVNNETSSLDQMCKTIKENNSDTLSQVNSLEHKDKKEIITINNQNFNTSYVKYGVNINLLNKQDKFKFYNENWTVLDNILKDFSVKSITHTSTHQVITTMIEYKFSK